MGPHPSQSPSFKPRRTNPCDWSAEEYGLTDSPAVSEKRRCRNRIAGASAPLQNEAAIESDPLRTGSIANAESFCGSGLPSDGSRAWQGRATAGAWIAALL